MKRLGAVLLADVAGYSKMMSYDEPGTLQKIKQFSEQILRPLLEKYKGKLLRAWVMAGSLNLIAPPIVWNLDNMSKEL